MIATPTTASPMKYAGGFHHKIVLGCIFLCMCDWLYVFVHWYYSRSTACLHIYTPARYQLCVFHNVKPLIELSNDHFGSVLSSQKCVRGGFGPKAMKSKIWSDWAGTALKSPTRTGASTEKDFSKILSLKHKDPFAVTSSIQRDKPDFKVTLFKQF